MQFIDDGDRKQVAEVTHTVLACNLAAVVLCCSTHDIILINPN